jgi:cation diffusion facilitator CzcD-associated flavoprotein CzcO
MAEDVLVIGAGPAGIASAYYLEQAGLSYKVIDQADEIATTWNSLYPSLRLNTSRFFSHMPGRRFPLRYGLFATGKQYHQYVTQYVRDHGFNIHLGVTVHRVYPEGQGWRVESSEGSHWYPAVISATGRFGAPMMPRFPGMDDFAGRIIHAKDYLGPEPYTGKRVMIVGNGPSGVDISTELGDHAATPVLLSQRTGVILAPRYPLGLPKHLWMIIGELLPDAIGQPLVKWVNGIQYKNLDRIGIKVPRSPEETTAAGGTRGRELIRAVRAGKVRCVDGPARFDGAEVVLTDDSRHAVDVVIMATGYRPVLWDYLEIEAQTDREGWPCRLDNLDEGGQRQVAGYPGLYLVGVFYKGNGAMYNFNTEARQAVAEIRQRLAELRPSHADPVPTSDR